jgi:hypothetical protein
MALFLFHSNNISEMNPLPPGPNVQLANALDPKDKQVKGK